MWNICALCAREPVAEPISTTAGTYTQTHRSHIGYNNFDYNTFTNKMTMLNIMEIYLPNIKSDFVSNICAGVHIHLRRRQSPRSRHVHSNTYIQYWSYKFLPNIYKQYKMTMLNVMKMVTVTKQVNLYSKFWFDVEYMCKVCA